MIYLKNIREKQTVYIPRTEINSKVVVIKSYDEGYADGIVEGKKLQKLKLTNLTVSENGVYKREDGWNEVEVDVKPSLQSKTINVTKDVETVMADDAFDGLSKVNVNATQYGQDKRNEGYTDGYTTGKADGTEEGYQSGKQDGIEEGYQNGYNTGKEDGTEEGYAQGKTDGYTEGYEDGIAEGGKIDVDDTQVMNITANGTYTTQYTKSEDVGRDITGYFDDNTPFYGYAHLTNHIIAIGLIATKTSKVELWWRPDFNGSGSIQYVFASSSPIFGGFYLRVDGGKFSVKFGNYTKNNQLAVEDKWYHIVVSPDGLVIDGETITTLGTPTMFMAGNNMFINGDGTASNPLCANGYFGMVKIDGKTFIPTEDGFIDYATDRILTVNKKGDYDYENPTYDGNLIRTVHVNVPQNTLKTQNKILTVTKDLEVVYPDSGYNALAEVSVDATQYGQEKQNEGYTKGHLQGKTEGYENGKADGIEEGYNQGYADGKAEGGDVELIDISDAPKMEQVNPSNNLVYTPSEYNANGFSKVSINVTNIYDEGYNEGYAEGQGSSAGIINVKEVGIKFGRSTFAELPPYYDFKDVVNMDSMFDGCENLRTIPEISTSNVTTMEYTFGLCKSLTTIPMLDTSNVTDMDGTFSNCQSLITIPELNTSMVWSMNGLFHGCTSLTSIPYLDTSRVADMQNMFAGCKNLTSVPNLTTDKVEYMTSMFSSCESLTTIPELNTSNVIGMNYLLSGCINLVSVPPLNAGKVNAGKANGIEHFFGSTELPNLTDFGGLIGLKSSMTDNYGFVKTPNLSYQSCINILNGLYNFKGNGLNPNVFQGKLKVHKNFLDLVGDEISIATNKGWTITA